MSITKGTTFSFSTETPETFDAEGFEKLEFTGVGSISNKKKKKRDRALKAAAHEMYAMLMFLVSNDSINDVSLDTEVHDLLAKARGEK